MFENLGITILIFGVIMMCFSVFSSMIVITKNKYASIIETFGKYTSTKSAGLAFKLPWPIQVVTSRVSLNIQSISTDLSLKTKDNLFIKYPIKVQYQVLDPVKANYELDSPKEQILGYVANLVRTEVGQRSFLELYNSRDELQLAIEETLSEKLESFGFKIVAILVEEPIPTEDVQASYNSVTASEREKEAARNVAEARKIQVIAEAEAQKESKRLQGEGIAAQRDAIGKGLVDSIENISKTFGISSAMATAMILQLNKLDTLRDVSHNKGSVIVIDTAADSETKQINAGIIASKTLESIS